MPTTATAVATGSAIRVLSASTTAEAKARRKAAFCEAVWSLTRSGLPAYAAAAQAAVQADWTDIKHGERSIVTVQSAYRLYRLWTGKLGTLAEKQPNAGNWSALVEQYDNARDYVRPGADEFWNGLRKLYENENKPSLRYCYRLAKVICERAGLTNIPTYDQAKHWYTVHADKRQVALAREGEEHARLQIVGHIMREAPAPRECWFSDHHIFDAAVRVFDEQAGKWRAVRPWLTAWLDWGSLYFEGVLIRAISPNRDAIERALRMGIQNHGMTPPRHVYIDNGRDYKAAGFARLKDDEKARLESVCGQLGIKAHFAIPYNARAKVIERIFGIVCGQFSKLWPSYRGSTPEHRPEAADEAWKDAESLPTLAQFESAFRQWLAVIYHGTRSTGQILAGKSPLEARSAAPALRAAMTAEDLQRAFLRELPGGARAIRAGGVVRVAGQFFQSETLYQFMAREREVIVKVDPDNVANVFAFTTTGKLLCQLAAVTRVPGLVGDDPVAIEALREQTKEKQRRMRELKSVARIQGRTTTNLATGVFALPDDLTPPQTRLKSAAMAPVAPSADDMAAQAEIDAALREESAANKAALFDAPAEQFADLDAADLAAIEAELTNHND